MKELAKRLCVGTLDQANAFLARFEATHIEKHRPNSVALRAGQAEPPNGYTQASRLAIVRPNEDIRYDQGIVAWGQTVGSKANLIVIAVISSHAEDIPQEILCYAEELKSFEVEQTIAGDGQQGAIAQRIGTWILPGSIDSINAAMWKYLKGKARGWCDYDRPQEAGPGVLVYHLKQYQIGEFGEVTLSTLDEQHTEVNVDVLRLPPLTPNRDEINRQREVHLRNVIGFVMDRVTEDRRDIEKLQTSKGDERQGKQKNKGGRPHYAEDEWAADELERGRPRDEVIKDWLEKTKASGRQFADFQESFDKQMSAVRKRREKTAKTE